MQRRGSAEMGRLSRRAGRGMVAALVAAVVSGFSVWVNGQVVTRVKVFSDLGTYTTAKNLVAAVVVVAAMVLAGWRRPTMGWTRPSRASQWWGLLAVAIVGGSVPFLLFFEGLARSGSPADAQLVHKAGLLAVVAVLGPLVLRERLGVLQLVGLAAVLAGYLVLATDLGGIGFGTGLVLVLAAAALWGIETVVDRWLLAELSPATVASARLGAGVVILLGVGLFTGDTARLGDLGAAGWGWAVLTGMILAGYVAAWMVALANAQAVDVTAVLALAVPVTAVVADLADGVAPARPGALTVLALGAAVVVAGALTTRPRFAPRWAEL